MMSFKSDFKRARPLLGTFFTISVAETDGEAASRALSIAFSEAERLESIFSLTRPDSELNRVNQAAPDQRVEVSSELFHLLQLAESLWRRSRGAFNPFFPLTFESTAKLFHYSMEGGGRFRLQKTRAVTLDLNGIAKGYIIDRTVEALRRELPQASGVVNVGGDLRFFNTDKRCVSLRMGAPESGLARSLLSDHDGIATSSPAVAAKDPRSSTRYPVSLRVGLTIDHTAVAMASCATLADSLTKLALFGSAEAVSACAVTFGARVLIFDPEGRLAEEYGAA